MTSFASNRPTSFFVSPNGCDRTGDGSAERPFRTPEKARDAIRDLPALPDGGITVWFRGGEYGLTETFTLTPADSGEPEKPIVYAAAPGEEVRFVSKERITGWRRLTAPERAGEIFGMSQEAKANVYVAEIPAGWRFHTLYADGVRLPGSRMTESDAWEKDWPRAMAGREDYGPEGLYARFGEGVLDGLEGWEDAEVRLITAIWWNVNAVLAGIDPGKRAAYIRSRLTVFYPDFRSMGGQYNLMNTPKYLTAGEWCVDSVRGRVYWWPAGGQDPNAVCLFAPKLRELVRFQGDEEEDGWVRQVRCVTLRDLTFLYTDRIPETELDSKWLTRNGESPDGMLYFQGADHCSVEGCVLGYSGGQGIVLDHWAQNCAVTGCEIGYASSGGVYLTGYGPGTTDLNHHNTIARNHIHHVGLDYMHSCAVQFFASNHNTVEYNYFHDLPYAAISIIGMAWHQMQNGPASVDTCNTFGESRTMYNARWDEIGPVADYLDAIPYQNSGESVIQYNICDDYMQTLRDGGALYCWCSGRDKVWQHNCGARAFTDDWAVRAIHIDDCDGFSFIYQNLFFASGATDNSHTNGAAGGRGDGGRTDLDIWDDTVSDNIWKENIIRADVYPEGYLALRESIVREAGGWLSKLPGA
ncbi:MAG: right-handed parallel beta-helix repeat-containing protein [Clostridiales bacterium]|nr:right-handed parallel beta-helix repeat-containing protein [Clostridiales bacterium]